MSSTAGFTVSNGPRRAPDVPHPIARNERPTAVAGSRAGGVTVPTDPGREPGR